MLKLSLSAVLLLLLFMMSANTLQTFSQFTNINLSNQAYPQNEPSVRISRTNPNAIVCAFRDFRLGYYNPAYRRVGYVRSTDGGATWSESTLLPDPNPGGHVGQSDPVVTSDAQGNFYISTLSVKQYQTPWDGDVVIYKSTDEGLTWVEYATAIYSSGSGNGEDKEWLVCDPVPTNPTYNNLLIVSQDMNNNLVHFTRSTNGGLNWTSPVRVSDERGGRGFPCVAAGTTGEIYVVWNFGGIQFDKSTNGGTTWKKDVTVSRPGSNFFGMPFICVDYSNGPRRGYVYVVWSSNSGGNDQNCWFQRSTDKGATWLKNPIRINDVAANHQYWPAIQCDENGNLRTVYYDNRANSAQWNAYYAYSTNGGSTWINQLLSSSWFPRLDTNRDLRFGDYIGIDCFAGKIIPVWTDDRSGWPNHEIYTATFGSFSPPILVEENSLKPLKFALEQNYPNPFNPATKIRISLPIPSTRLRNGQEGGVYDVKLVVYDILGHEVASLLPSLRGGQEGLSPGTYQINFDGTNYPSGVYFYKLTAGDFTAVKKMILIK